VRKCKMLFVLAGVLLMAACGSSGGGSTASTITSVTAACSPSTIQPGQTSQCSASVTGTGSFSSAVTWTASAGTITTSGMFTAPTVSSATTVTITATSSQDTTKSGTATVTVNPSSTITSVNVTCSPSTVQSGQTSQCSATVSGTGNFSSAVTWTTSAGQISSSGLLTAPIVSGNTPVMVTATSTQDNTMSGTATHTVTATAAATNVAPLIVDAGPDPQNFTSGNVPFVTITVCFPGSTTQCQTIDHVTVDTGSSGLRIVSTVLKISLRPELNPSSGNPLDECLVFLDGYVWGPVATADITVAGETASNVPVQVMIPDAGPPAVPSTCTNPPGGNGNEGGSVDTFRANALMGVGLFQQDCGPGCTSQNSSPPDVYYDCPASGCNQNPVFVNLPQQVANPVSMFTADNNGVLIQFPAVPDGGSLTASGFLIFGIGTESNNTLGSSMVYPVSDTGDFTTVFNGASYPSSFIDSGSNGFFFPDANIPQCPGSPVTRPNTWYCPATSPDNLTAVNQGSNGQSGPITNFSIENTISLLNTDNTAFSTLGGPSGAGENSSFDFGLSFFFGRDVFTAIENMSTPGGTGPYFGYNLP